MKRLECLDGLRGALAVYVVLGHMAPFAMLPRWFETASGHGGAAVDIFFILSGLVIAQSLDRLRGDRRRFLVARLLRIYPVFLPVFVVALLVQPLPCGFDQMPWVGPDSAARYICSSHWDMRWQIEIAAHLFMVHGLFPTGVLPDVWVSFLGAAWSLSTEWQFYILAMFAWRLGERRITAGLMLLAFAALAWHLAAPQGWQFSRAFLPNKAHFFALGLASHAVMQRRHGALIGFGMTLALTTAICAIDGRIGKLLPPLIWTACLAAQSPHDIPGLTQLHRLLSSRVALWFGSISFPLYLVNEPVHKVLAPLVSRFAAGDAMLFTIVWVPTCLSISVLAAAWLNRHIEAPAMRLRHSLVFEPQPSGSRPTLRAEPLAATPLTTALGARTQPVTVQGAERGL